MPNRFVVALAAAFFLWPGATVPQQTSFVSELSWGVDDPRFGGLSGLEVSADGAAFTAVGDRGLVVQGRLRRENGRIAGVEGVGLSDLAINDAPRETRRLTDAEGLAGSTDGAFFVSFEAVHRVDRYSAADAEPQRLPLPAHRRGFYENGGLEALAIDGSDRLFAIPENKRRRVPDYPVFRYDRGEWDTAFRLLGRDDMHPVGADFGPDGALYVLERSFHGIFGFSSRVRRLDPKSTGVVSGETLLQTRPGTHDNLEGIAVWRDRDGMLRLTMVSDNNFSIFQRTEFVEYRLTQ